MTDSQDSQQWQELLADYVLGDVTSEEAETVHRLSISHPEIQAEIDRLQEALALVSLSLPQSSPPPDLGEKIFQLAQVTPTNSIVELPKRKVKLRVLALSSTAISLILGLGLSNYYLHQEVGILQANLAQHQQQIAALPEPKNRLFSLQGTDQSPTATGVVLILPNTQKAVITLQNLTSLPRDKVYRLWAVVNGKKVDCGQFNANDKGQVLMQMPLDRNIHNISTVLVTIEPASAVSQPTGVTVMTGTI